MKKPQLGVQGAFDVCRGTINIEQQTIWVGAGEDEMVGFGESNDSLVIRFRGAESFDELIRREKFAEIRTGRIIELLEQVGEGALIAQRQTDHQIDALL